VVKVKDYRISEAKNNGDQKTKQAQLGGRFVRSGANGGAVKKPQSSLKKPKLEKALPAQNNGVSSKKLQKAEKSKSKKEAKAPSADVLAAKKSKKAAELAKKKENRKDARKEKGQYKPDKLQLNAEQLQVRIDAITSRPELTKTAKRKLAVYRKRLQIVKGTYVPKPRPEDSELTKSQTRHRPKTARNAKRAQEKLMLKKMFQTKPRVLFPSRFRRNKRLSSPL